MKSDLGKDIQYKEDIQRMKSDLGKDIQDKEDIQRMKSDLGKDIQDKEDIQRMKACIVDLIFCYPADLFNFFFMSKSI